MNTPRTKQELQAAAEALFRDIDADFGKKKKAEPKPVVAKQASISEGAEANRIAELMSSRSPWKPISVISHLVTQVCNCCRGETEFVGNTLVRHKHKTHGYTWDHILPESPEHTLLPHEIQNHRVMVEQCPTCIRVNFTQMPVATHGLQMSLFH